MRRSQVPAFDQAQVLVLGDVMLDRYWHGATSRISPEAPVPVVHVGDQEDRPGGAANVALNIAALGGQATLLALVGEDEAAQVLQQQLQQAQVQCRFATIPGKPTITKLRVLSRHQQLIRLDFEQGFTEADNVQLMDRFTQCLDGVGAVILSDYGKGVLGDPQPFIQAARVCGVPVLVDPKRTDFSDYRGATLITPNLHEFEAVVGPCVDEQAIVDKGLALIAEHDLTALLVTRGEQGMTLLQQGVAPLHLPTQAREVFDVTGAGDTVISVLAAGLAAQQSLATSTTLANLAAGVVVGKLGTATVSVAELRDSLEPEPTLEAVLDEESLILQVQQAQRQGQRVVFTNGCFDLLHAGHVSYLREAKALGDRLVVAVNSDESVAALKGPTRPVNALLERMTVLAALGAVDWVVPFSEETPGRLIAALQPDVLVKGGDYQLDEIVGADTVRGRGGEVVVLSFKEGCSTTSMIERIQQQVDENE